MTCLRKTGLSFFVVTFIVSLIWMCLINHIEHDDRSKLFIIDNINYSTLRNHVIASSMESLDMLWPFYRKISKNGVGMTTFQERNEVFNTTLGFGVEGVTNKILNDRFGMNKLESYGPNGTVKLIVLWENVIGINHFGRRPFGECEYRNCILTRNKSVVSEAQFVIIPLRIKIPWPTVRHQDQFYVHMINERPCSDHENWLAEYDDKINLTWNYRRDADIYINVLGGFYKLDDPLPEPYVPTWHLANKTKNVAWMVSHCGAESKRDDYVAELAKYIDVDIYGRCGNMNFSCPGGFYGTKECAYKFGREYNFYLAFENAICDGYATEKLYRSLKYDLIPVVLGKVNYSIETPPHSVIDVRDFESPKALAEYLKHIVANEDEYYSYFKWKQFYGIGSFHNVYCALCAGVNNPALAGGKPAGGYYDWWFGGCDNDLVDRMRQRGGW